MRILCLITLTLITSLFANEVINVHVQQRNPELFWDKTTQTAQGPIIEISNELFKNLKLTPAYSPVPWVRTLRAAKNAEEIFLIRHSMTDERRSFLNPILYGFEERNVLFYSLKKRNIQISSYEDLKKHNIGFRRGSFYFPGFMEDKKLKRTPIRTDEQLIKMLSVGRLDLVIFNYENLFQKTLSKMKDVKQSEFQKQLYVKKYLNPRYFSIPLKSKLNKSHKKINCEMYRLRKNGFVNKAFKGAGLKPLIQSYIHNISKKQSLSCK